MSTDNRDDFLTRVARFFDLDETAGEFCAEDGDGGFVGAAYRMAREIERLRAMLSAAPDAPGEPADAPAQAVRVKPLVWEERHAEPTRANDLTARTVAGTYAIRPSADGLKFRVFVPGGIFHEAPEFKDLDGAKAFAQAHNERCVLSALEPAPDLSAIRAEGVDLDRDIGLLLASLEFFAEATGESLDPEDAAVVHQIKVDHERRISIRALATEGK